eukprot:CAMPEP_0178399008 /NCGR_PEP_ID=MMETSP0689_2-20121128/15061_1 /TAXON_ID=160604 /ORGANISM="Amphidinium massartii, Strain CS-259" /LENGTH=129 /DNA_ID=CAMNT_0020019777 /DNA_START=77 /DNA_END=466 /DNA_ORIENTATION=+
MARRSSSLLSVLAVFAVVAYLAAPSAFVAPPGAMQRSNTLGAAVVTGSLMAPQVASAAEQAYDQFSPAELVAITIPFVLVALSYSEWEGYQIPTDQELGPGTLRKARNGPGGSKGATLMGDSPVGFELK